MTDEEARNAARWVVAILAPDVDVPHDAEVTEVESGYWVEAWVWVPKEEDE